MILFKFNRRMTAVFLLVASLMTLLTSAIWYITTAHRVAASISTKGTIIEFLRKNENGNTLFFPVFRFRDLHGENHTVYSTSGTFPPPNQVGDQVTVIYIGTSPQDAMIKDSVTFVLMPLLLLGLGVTYLLAGFVMWYWPSILARVKK
jgi:hypothetical protein